MDKVLSIKNKNSRIFIRLIVSCLILATLYLLLYTRSFAQTPSSVRVITIVPPSSSHTLSPGEKAEGVLKVINDSDTPITFTAVVRDYVVNDTHGTPTILPPNTLSNKYSAAAWLGIAPQSFTVAPHQRQELNYYLQAPQDARPGGHYAAVIYEPTDIIGVNGSGTGVQTQIGTLFYINVKGSITEAAAVTNFSAKGFNEYGPVTITTEIANNGDLHIRPVGKIVVKNLIGQTVDSQNLAEHNIFPGKSLLYSSSFGQKWMLGFYTARLSATYGETNNLPLAASVSFVVFPWKVVIVTVLIVVIILLAFELLGRKKRKGEHEENEEPSSPSNHPTL